MAGEEDGEFAVAGEGLGEADGRGLGEREGEGDGEVVFAGLDDGAVVLDCVGLLVEEVVCGVAETEGGGRRGRRCSRASFDEQLYLFLFLLVQILIISDILFQL